MQKGKEIISLYIGEAGCQVGSTCWEMYCLEHGVRPDGVICQSENQCGNFFSLTTTDKAVPRTIFIDSEPTAMDTIRKGKFRKLFNPQSLISGKEDAFCCFARGYYTLSKDFVNLLMQRIRAMADDCENLQGFLLHRASGGGTGSGLGSFIIEKLSEEYPKCDVVEFSIYSDSDFTPVIVEPYNTILATHQSLEYTSANFIIDNGSCFDICNQFLGVSAPSYNNVNLLLGHIIPSVTASFRYECNVNVDFSDMKTKLVPYPRLQYPIISYAPLISKTQTSFDNVTESTLMSQCLHPSSQIVKCDTRKGQYITCTVLFRGDINKACLSSAISSIRAKKAVRFVEWSPSDFKVGINTVPPTTLPGADLGEVSRTCVMLANSSAIRTMWTKMLQKFDNMYSKKAFVHWYMMEGLDQGDFEEARLNLGALEQDYAEIAQ